MSKKYALIIGNSSFNDLRLSKLNAPDVDVKGLENVLKDPKIGHFDEVISLTNSPLEDIRIAISRLFYNKKREDLILLYLSGHGILDDYGRLFLATTNTNKEFLNASALSANFITEEMNYSRSRRQILILDCCHSGAFDKGSKSGNLIGTGKAFMGNGYGRAVLTASDSTQYAWEGEHLFANYIGNSVFTHCLIEGLETGKADLNGDGIISIDELFDYVYEKVVENTPKQTPGKWTYKQQGNIEVAKNPFIIKPAEKLIDILPEIEFINYKKRIWNSPDGTIFNEIPVGSFQMGATMYSDERPVHKVSFNSPFFIASTLVTNAQFTNFCKSTQYRSQNKKFLFHLKANFFTKEWKNPNAPVCFISWLDAKEYILWKCEQDNIDYRLPTEAQWEYACRAGTRTTYYWGNNYDDTKLNCNQILQAPTPIKNYPENPWGLYDMLGNLWEWTEDIKDVKPSEVSVFYDKCSKLDNCVNPVNTNPNFIKSKNIADNLRVIKGGSWYSKAQNLRPSNRRGEFQDNCLRSIGFRLAAFNINYKLVSEPKSE